MTRYYKQLKRELGTSLFDRNTRSVRLASSGQALVEPAREVLQALRRAEAAVRSADNGEVGLVRIAFAGLSTTRSSPGSPVLPDRLRRLAQENGFVPDVVQVAPDTQTALALVSAEVGCHLTPASVAENAVDPHVVFVPLDGSIPDVDLRGAWRRNDRSPALRTVLDELFVLDAAPMTTRLSPRQAGDHHGRTAG